MSAAAQLRLVTEAPAVSFGCAPADSTRVVFEHWLFMFGRSPRRCKLGPGRRQAINAALALYDVETLELAIEGIASDPLTDCTESMREAMHEIEWLLAKEARIERYAGRGEKLRASHERQAQRAAQQPLAVVTAVDPATEAAEQAKAQAHREQLRAFAAQLAGRGVVA